MSFSRSVFNIAAVVFALSLFAVPSLAQEKTETAPAGENANSQPADAKDLVLSSLFNGDSLEGWTILGGKHTFEIKDGVITGTCVEGEANGFLCTDKKYSDFVLELEFKAHEKMNSGIQIRSNTYEKDTKITIDWGNGPINKTEPKGRVYGYQVEIDTAGRRCGAIYDEARTGWLDRMDGNEAAFEAVKANDWNHFRIVCKGTHLQTWINGVPAANIQNDMTASGFIGLQVHGAFNKKEMIGTNVMWRNVKLAELPEIEPKAAK